MPERGDIVGGRFLITGGPVSIWVVGRQPYCRDVQCGGQHYHCPRCGAVTGMTGHSDEAACAVAHARGEADRQWVTAYRAESDAGSTDG